MRILVISNLYPSPAHPGFGTFVQARVTALRATGADVDVVAIRDPVAHRRVVAKYASLTWSAGLTAMGDIVRRRRVDVVEAHIAYPTGVIARPVAAVLRAPLVLYAHGADIRDLPARSAGHARLARSTLGAAVLVVANSRFLAAEIGRRYPRLTDRVRVLSPGIELDRFAFDPGAPRTGILFVGRLVPEKGGDVLIRAVAGLGREAERLTMLGEGPERARLARLAADLGVDLDLRGGVGPDVVAAEMARAAVVVVPSVYPEPLGLVALEAMASGAIVVASAVGGLVEVVEDGVTGLAVQPGDADALGTAIRRAEGLARDPAAGTAMRVAGRAMAEAHDIARSAAASIAWYGTLRR